MTEFEKARDEFIKDASNIYIAKASADWAYEYCLSNRIELRKEIKERYLNEIEALQAEADALAVALKTCMGIEESGGFVDGQIRHEALARYEKFKELSDCK